MAEVKKEVKKVEEKTVVVAQLPSQQVNKALDENGNTINLITIEDAITDLLERVKRIEKGVA